MLDGFCGSGTAIGPYGFSGDFLPFALRLETLGSLVTAAQGDDVPTHLAKEFPLGDTFSLGELFAEDAVVGGEPRGERFGERRSAFGIGAAGKDILAEVAGDLASLLFQKPLQEAALVPGGEVGWVDRLAVEFAGQDGLDLGECIEPGNEFEALFAIVQALVELGANLQWEAGDFAGAGGAHGCDGFSDAIVAL